MSLPVDLSTAGTLIVLSQDLRDLDSPASVLPDYVDIMKTVRLTGEFVGKADALPFQTEEDASALEKLANQVVEQVDLALSQSCTASEVELLSQNKNRALYHKSRVFLRNAKYLLQRNLYKEARRYLDRAITSANDAQLHCSEASTILTKAQSLLKLYEDNPPPPSH